MDKNLIKYISQVMKKLFLLKITKITTDIYVGPPGFEPESMAPKATSIPG